MAEERLARAQFYIGIILGLAVAAIPLVAPKLFGRTDVISENVLKLGKLGWSLVSVGFVIILASFYCARQWVEGRTVHAGVLIASAGFAGLMGYSFEWTASRQKNTIEQESVRLQKEATALAPNTQLFAATDEADATDATLTFYLERPVLTVRKELGGANAPPPPRALIATPLQLKKFGLQPPAPIAPPGQQFVMVPNVSEEDWEGIIKSVSEGGSKGP
jgi:hypothetical protein